MRMRTRRTMVIAACVAVLVAAGCQILWRSVDTPNKRIKLAANTYRATQSTLEDMIDADQIDPDEVDVVEKYDPIAVEALKKWRRATRQGLDAGKMARKFWEAIGRLQQITEGNDGSQ